MKRRPLRLILTLLLVSLSLLLNPVSAQPLQPMLVSSGNLLVNGSFDQGLTGWISHKLTPSDQVKCVGGECVFQWEVGRITERRRGLKVKLDYAGLPGDQVQFAADYYFTRPAVQVKVTVFYDDGTSRQTFCKYAHRVRFGCGVPAALPYHQIKVTVLSRGGSDASLDNASLQVFRTVRSD